MQLVRPIGTFLIHTAYVTAPRGFVHNHAPHRDANCRNFRDFRDMRRFSALPSVLALPTGPGVTESELPSILTNAFDLLPRTPDPVVVQEGLPSEGPQPGRSPADYVDPFNHGGRAPNKLEESHNLEGGYPVEVPQQTYDPPTSNRSEHWRSDSRSGVRGHDFDKTEYRKKKPKTLEPIEVRLSLRIHEADLQNKCVFFRKKALKGYPLNLIIRTDGDPDQFMLAAEGILRKAKSFLFDACIPAGNVTKSKSSIMLRFKPRYTPEADPSYRDKRGYRSESSSIYQRSPPRDSQTRPPPAYSQGSFQQSDAGSYPSTPVGSYPGPESGSYASTEDGPYRSDEVQQVNAGNTFYDPNIGRHPYTRITGSFNQPAPHSQSYPTSNAGYSQHGSAPYTPPDHSYQAGFYGYQRNDGTAARDATPYTNNSGGFFIDPSRFSSYMGQSHANQGTFSGSTDTYSPDPARYRHEQGPSQVMQGSFPMDPASFRANTPTFPVDMGTYQPNPNAGQYPGSGLPPAFAQGNLNVAGPYQYSRFGQSGAQPQGQGHGQMTALSPSQPNYGQTSSVHPSSAEANSGQSGSGQGNWNQQPYQGPPQDQSSSGGTPAGYSRFGTPTPSDPPVPGHSSPVSRFITLNKSKAAVTDKDRGAEPAPGLVDGSGEPRAVESPGGKWKVLHKNK